jgi:hypothetical protein
VLDGEIMKMINKYYMMKEVRLDRPSSTPRLYNVESRDSKNELDKLVSSTEKSDLNDGIERRIIKLRSVKFKIKNGEGRVGFFDRVKDLRVLLHDKSYPIAKVLDEEDQHVGHGYMNDGFRVFDSIQELTVGHQELQHDPNYLIIDVVKEI